MAVHLAFARVQAQAIPSHPRTAPIRQRPTVVAPDRLQDSASSILAALLTAMFARGQTPVKRTQRYASRTICLATGSSSSTSVGLTTVQEDDLNARRIEWALSTKSTAELKQLCKELGGKGSTQKRSMLRFLSDPSRQAALLKLLHPEEKVPLSMSPETIAALQEKLQAAAARKLPGGGINFVLAKPEVQDAAEKVVKMGLASIDSDENWQLFDVREHSDVKAKKRKALATIKLGQHLNGRIVAVALTDGLRIDVGTEVDAIVPIDLSQNQELLEFLQDEYPVGSDIKVIVDEIIDEGQRFPLLCSIDPTLVERFPSAPNSKSRSGVEEAADALSLSQLGDTLADRKHPEADSLVGGEWQDILRLPPRIPPSEVRSIDADGSLRIVDVPEEHRVAPDTDADDDSLEAWKRYALNATEMISYELRCRDQLARDLETVEADIAAGLHPSVPVEVMGMVVLGDKQSCLLPLPEGDCLKFKVHVCESSEELASWLDEVWNAHEQLKEVELPETEEKRLTAMERLAELFSCTDAFHSRVVLAAETEELRRNKYSESDVVNAEIDEEYGQGMETEILEALEEIPELNQKKLEEAWNRKS